MLLKILLGLLIFSLGGCCGTLVMAFIIGATKGWKDE